jgi:CysZ protein
LVDYLEQKEIVMQGSPTKALAYFIAGAKMISQPGFRRFVVIPLLINLVIFVAATFVLIYSFQHFFAEILAWLPSWLAWLSWILWPIIGITFLIVYGYSFNLITNFIAAPFFGFLAEKIEAELTGVKPPDEPWSQLIPRTFARELSKLWYFMSRGFLVLLMFLALFFIPGVNIVGACLAALWSCWCMAVQYVDFPADNHQLRFVELRHRLKQQPFTSYPFGGIVLLGCMIPVINIVISPIAVAAATIFWVREIRTTKP